MPDFSDFPFLDAPENLRLSTVQIVGCNYVQVIEGLLDSSHLSLLHISPFTQVGLPDIQFVQNTEHMPHDPAPRVEAQEKDFGLLYAEDRGVETARTWCKE